MKVFSILKCFVKSIFLDLFHHFHKYKIVARYFTENESEGFHDIEAFVVYKCELCGDIYCKRIPPLLSYEVAVRLSE